MLSTRALAEVVAAACAIGVLAVAAMLATTAALASKAAMRTVFIWIRSLSPPRGRAACRRHTRLSEQCSDRGRVPGAGNRRAPTAAAVAAAHRFAHCSAKASGGNVHG